MTLPDSDGRLEGRVALVTGGVAGIGRSIVERLLRDGANVVVGDIDDAGLAALTADREDRCVALHCDVTDDEGPEALSALALERFGRLDIAVANAGGGIGELIADMTIVQWRSVIDLTLTSAFLTIGAAARRINDGGSIVAIASLNAVQPGVATSAYCAAKAGVVALVDVAALELGPRGVRVNAVAPGLVRTQATEPMWRRPEIVAEYVENTALGRYGEVDDVAAAVAFLASDDSTYITGQTLLVDGGAHHLRYPDPRRVRTGPPEVDGLTTRT